MTFVSVVPFLCHFCALWGLALGTPRQGSWGMTRADPMWLSLEGLGLCTHSRGSTAGACQGDQIHRPPWPLCPVAPAVGWGAAGLHLSWHPYSPPPPAARQEIWREVPQIRDCPTTAQPWAGVQGELPRNLCYFHHWQQQHPWGHPFSPNLERQGGLGGLVPLLCQQPTTSPLHGCTRGGAAKAQFLGGPGSVSFSLAEIGWMP